MSWTKPVGVFPYSNLRLVSCILCIFQACGIYLERRAAGESHTSVESDQSSVLSEMFFTSSKCLRKCMRTEEMYVASSLLTPSLCILPQLPAICG